MPVDTTTPSKPVRMLRPRDSRERRIVARLTRDSTNPDWLPDRMSPKLDSLRAHQRKHALQLHSERDKFDALTRQYRNEDAEHGTRLEQAFAGDDDRAEDTRTPQAQRDASFRDVEHRFWAAAALCADVCDDIDAALRSEEDAVLAALGKNDDAIYEKIAELESEITQLGIESARLTARARWYQRLCDGDGFARSRSPESEITAPSRRDPSAFKRPYFKERDHGERRAPVSRVVRRSDGDPSGIVFGLDDPTGAEAQPAEATE